MNSEVNIKSVELLRLIVSTCIGPRGRLKIIHNNCGGHVSLTSTASILLQNIRIVNPVAQVIASAAISHLRARENDGGLYLMILVTELLARLRKLTKDIPQNVVTSIFRQISKNVTEHMSERCDFKIAVNFDSLQLLMAVLNTVLKSKPGCQLSKSDRQRLINLLLKVFLDASDLTADGAPYLGSLQYVSVCGLSPDMSRIYPGLLISEKELEWTNSHRQLVKKYSGHALPCALFRVSLSGDADLDGLSDALWTMPAGINITETCTSQIINLCKSLVASGVKVVACQKVIHPRVKKYLNFSQIITLDRLGLINFNDVVDLTGATPLESYIQPLNAACFGTIHGLSLLTVHKLTYCHFEDLSRRVNTLVLCNYHEESLQELKAVCRQGMATLRGLLHTPYVLFGGGCLEMHLASFVKGLHDDIASEPLMVNVKKWHLLKVLETVAESFKRVATHVQKVTQFDVIEGDDTRQHFRYAKDGDTENKCACGVYRFEDVNCCGIKLDDIDMEVNLDSFWIKFSALKSAFEVTETLLKVDNIIK